MELIQQPDLKITYDKCKYRVKLWEHQFKKKNNRLPSKLDIREADGEVRLAYKTYFNLKSAALEQSFRDVDGFNSDEESAKTSGLNDDNDFNLSNENGSESVVDKGTWGEHLNNAKKEVVASAREKSDVNTSFTRKLFVGSKFSRRNPRKSLSFNRQKSESNSNLAGSLSQPVMGFVENETNCQPAAFNDRVNFSGVKFTSVAPRINCDSVNIVQSVLNNDYKQKQTLDSGWIERMGVGSTGENVDVANFACSRNLLSNFAKLDDDSDDIIDKSDDDDDYLHVVKKKKVGCGLNQSIAVHRSEKLCGENNPVCGPVKECLASGIQINANGFLGTIDKSAVSETKSKILDTSCKNNEDKVKAPRMKKLNKVKKATKPEMTSSRRSTRSKPAVSFKEDVSTDPYHTDDDGDPEFDPKTIRHVENSSTDEELTKTNKQTNHESNNDEDSYVLEYSVNPRIVSVPRLANVDVALKPKRTVSTGTSKREMDKDKLEKKMAAGNLNENFVRINLRKKVFVRGKKTVNFGKYKKQMWKNKKKALVGPDMDMGGCDGGSMVCFKCRKEGHFARMCKAGKGDALLPLEAAEEEVCPYPTLDEAAKVAQDSALAIRKPNFEGNVLDVDVQEGLADKIVDFGDSDDDLLAETVKLEEYVAKIDMKMYMDSTKFVTPYFELDEQQNVVDTPSIVLDTLGMFGHKSFRPGQERAIMRILSGKSTLVTLSTGSGKSLCYQIPAYLYSQREPCITLIISPLVSLMEDQVTGLPAFLKAACLHTNQSKTQREKVMEAVLSGALSILLVSPEAVAAGEKSTGFGSLLRRLPPIAFACIDEAHCVSQWSHNFRPSYLMICRILRERLGVRTILGLTATATRSTGDSIIRHLQIPDGRSGIISDVPLPDNLRLTVSKDYNKEQALLNLLMSDRFASCRSIIVYCTRREVCERIAAFLRTALKDDRRKEPTTKKRKRVDVQAEPYHAGMPAGRRKTIQKTFMSGELRIVVATVAFGMGINKSNIRAVIHYNMPSNFESYVQEVGRAGRDGLPAHCHLFLDAQDNDENELRRHIHANSMDRHVIRKLLKKIFVPCSCKEVCPKHEVAFSIQETVMEVDIPEENISTLLCYLELHENSYIQVLSPAYVTCKIISYGGATQIRKAAIDCPPLAMALALHGGDEKDDNIFEFPVVDVAAAMGWDSGICKHKLKNLEWITVNNQQKRSPLSVQFSNLGFRLLAPGNLKDNELDEALDNLHERVTNQETKGLLQLHAIHSTLTSVTEKTYRTCIDDEPSEKEVVLKAKIREYFESPNPLEELTKLETKSVDEDVIVGDIQQLVTMYRDNSFTGRAIARIFHGIQSPNYPAVMWGRCKYWRAHLKDDFGSICRIATREIIKMR